MLGEITYSAEGDRELRPAVCSLHGLSVLRVRVEPQGRWARYRVRRAARLLSRSGVRRVLTPEDFPYWEVLAQCGLRSVDPVPFLCAHAAPIAVASLRKRGCAPERSAVALRGVRVGQELAEAARELSGQVRDVCISAAGGGEQLRAELRCTYGLAVCPDFAGVSAAVRFDPRTWDGGETVLDLFSPERLAAQLEIGVPGTKEKLSLCRLAALWECGRVDRGDLEFT